MGLTKSDVKSLNTPFPSLGELFKEAWQLLLTRFARFVFFVLVQLGIFGLFAFIIALIIGGSIVALIAGHSNINWVAMAPSLITTGAILFVVLLILGLIFASLQTAWLLLAVNEDKAVPFGVIFRKGFNLILPLIWVGLITSFITFGGFFLLLLPALLFVLFFSLTQYEVVLDQQRGLNALKRSYTIITTHFGEIFVRIFILWVLMIIISFIPQMFAHTEAAFIVIAIFSIIQIIASWFSLCFTYLVYKQARERTDLNKTSSITWILVVAIIGWVIAALIIIGIISGISQLQKSGQLQKWVEQVAKLEATPTPIFENPLNNTVSPSELAPIYTSPTPSQYRYVPNNSVTRTPTI